MAGSVSLLTDDHIKHIVKTYEKFADEPGFARVVTLEEVRQQAGNLNIPMYVAALGRTTGTNGATAGDSIAESLAAWLKSEADVRSALDRVLEEKLRSSELPASSTVVMELPVWLTRIVWKRLPFGAFADSVNERVEPADAAEDTYVGLDDLDPGSLHIRRWGTGSDVIGTKLRFRKGDIIFGRRRAYQRKLAVAEMDGICSAHAMVVRAKPDLVLPDFLPFLMMSDRFMKRAVEISVGSLSPTINWTTLKLEEFDLPPLDKQRRIADILWAADALRSKQDEQLDSLVKLRDSRVREAARATTGSISLNALATAITSGSRGWAAHYTSEGGVFIRITNLQRASIRFDWTDIQRVTPPSTRETERTRVHDGDVLVSVTAELGLIAVAEHLPGECFINQHIAKVTLDRGRYDPYLAATFLSLPPYAEQFRKFNDQGAKAGMNLKNVAKLTLPALPKKSQAALAVELQSLESATRALEAQVEATSALVESLLNGLIESLAVTDVH